MRFYDLRYSGLWSLISRGFFLTFMVKMPTSLFSKQKGLQTSSELFGRSKNGIFGRTWLFLSQPFSTIGLFPQFGANAVKNRAMFSVIGTISRKLFTPSVTDFLCQSCAKQIDILLSEPTQKSLFTAFQRNAMSACSYVTGRTESVSHTLGIGERTNGHAHDMIRSGICNFHKGIDHYRIINGSLHNQVAGGRKLSYWCASSGATEFYSNFVPCFSLWKKDFRLACTAQYSTGAARNVSFDGVLHEEQLESSVVEQNRKSLGDRSLKLLSGSCYLPHPDKKQLEEKMHISYQVIGVADGVGGWADLGVDAGQYAKELMSNAGIHAVNLGDSGFIVVREGCTIFRSPVQQHDFNFTYQLESDNGSDLPSSAQVFTFPVESGDVIVAGTDGLFDNLYNTDINAIVVHAVRARLGPQVTAQKIAALARQRAQDKNRQTPFSTAAQDAGYRYYGGKLDDITVVVSYVTFNTA
ncbi:hypothetical protein IEQ34_021096 [Dendrobium chrysotoxum]|uniref:Protein phosphatase n=1 Tax=Dendrobium chrysotoxum TaxID=161865 RepID=A0AAV7FLI8_DENCH|nr:hypothetical protein IEQ34_021096 [Dendrobium chrysotoxum]